MARVLTDRYIQRLKPPATGRADHYDAKVPGLHLRLTAGGARSWRYFFRVGGRQRYLSWKGVLPLAEARARAKEAAGRVARGEDPAADRDAARRGTRDVARVKGLVGRFLVEYVEAKGLKDAREIRRIFTKYVLPEWGPRPAKEITRADVKALLGPIKARAPIMANRVKARLSKFFNWAVGEDVVGANPATHIEAEAEHARRRVLTAAEVRRLWLAFDTLGPVMSAFFKVRLLTAQRGGEVAALRWADLDEAGAWWTIPAAATKNGLPHLVYLNEPARAILAALPRAGAFVFPGRKPGAPLVAYQKAWQTAKRHAAVTLARAQAPDAPPERLEALVAADALLTARTHDLRRTAATGMGKLGVKPFIIGRVLNHKESGVTQRVYNLYDYAEEKRDALERWGRQVDALLAGAPGAAEVIPLEARRAEGAR